MNLLLDAAEVTAVAFAVLLVADLISGLFHWLEDSYGDEGWPIVGRLVTQANVLHHFEPRHMTYHSWFSSARGSLAGAGTRWSSLTSLASLAGRSFCSPL